MADASCLCETDTCNFAIMHYTNPRSRQFYPLGISNWGTIKTAGKALMAECLKKGSVSGGEIFVNDSMSISPVLVVFMWASGAPFEADLNTYENNPMYSAQLSQVAVGELGNNGTNNSYIGTGSRTNITLGMPTGIHSSSSAEISVSDKALGIPETA